MVTRVWDQKVPGSNPGAPTFRVLRWRRDEAAADGTVSLGARARPARPGCAPPGRRRPAVYDGVLLQGAVGTPAGVPAAVPQEPLPPAQAGRGEWSHAVRKD